MKKKADAPSQSADRNTMRPEYDFSKGVRGATAARFSQGTNVFMIDPDVLDVFPDATSVNEALRALAQVIREQWKRRGA